MLRDWWAEFFWSRTEKTKAAFRRGFALGLVCGLLIAAWSSSSA